MTAKVIAFRPRPTFRPGPRPGRPTGSSPSSPAVPVVSIEWDAVRALHVARCLCCADSFDSREAGPAERWAETHECDAELAALLDQITGGRVA